MLGCAGLGAGGLQAAVLGLQAVVLGLQAGVHGACRLGCKGLAGWGARGLQTVVLGLQTVVLGLQAGVHGACRPHLVGVAQFTPPLEQLALHAHVVLAAHLAHVTHRHERPAMQPHLAGQVEPR